MTKAFRVFAFLVAALVMFQAAVMVWGIAGLGLWLDDGNELTTEVFEDAFEGGEKPFPEFTGLMLHGMVGFMVIPIVSLITMILGFIAKHPGSTKFGVAIFLLTILQTFLGIYGHELAISGMAHGVNALILFGTAVMAGVRAKAPVSTTAPQTPVSA